MSSYSPVQKQPRPASQPRLSQAMLSLVYGVSLFFVLFLGVVVGFDMVYAGKIFPGVSVAGNDLSGLPPADAAALLAQHINYPQNGKIVFRDGDKVWIAKPVEVGLFFDPENSALAAYRFGRQGDPVTRLIDQFSAWYFGTNLSPLLVYDERIAQSYLNGIAKQANRPTIEASLSITGTDVVVRPAQVGRSLDMQATLAPLGNQLRSLSDGIVPLVMRESPPVILDVSEQAAIARQILSAPLVLTLPDAAQGDPGPWTFDQKKLAGMLTIERVESQGMARYQVGLKTEGLREFLTNLAPKLTRNPADARFTF
ncbi:MAG TPA: peptidoglycan binding domain-containing protein, partial [Anaerolineales bacterium]